MARTTINSLGIPDDTIVSADLDYPLTGFSSTGITDNAASTALTIDSSGNIAVTGTIDGRDLAADGTKLDGIAASATDYDDTDVASYLSTNGYDTATNIVATITDSAPLTLDTLNELAAALGDDPNFAATTAASIGLKAPLASPSFTGNVGIVGSLDLIGGRLDLSDDASPGLPASIQNTGTFGNQTSFASALSSSGQIQYSAADHLIADNSIVSSGYPGAWLRVNNGLTFGFGTSTAVTINSSQKVGIGTTDPSEALTIAKSGTSARISLTDMDSARASMTGLLEFDGTDSRAGFIGYDAGDMSLYAAVGDIKLSTGGAARLTIEETTGHLRIGDSANRASLRLENTAQSGFSVGAGFYTGSTQSTIEFQDSNTTANYKVRIGCETDDLLMFAGGSERMRIDASGNVGIGTSTISGGPASTLHVHSSVAGGPVPFGSESRVTISTNDLAAGNNGFLGSLFFGGQDVSSEQTAFTGAGVVGYAAGDLAEGNITADLLFYTQFGSNAPTEKMRIDSGGVVRIGGAGQGGLELRGPSTGTEGGQLDIQCAAGVGSYSIDTYTDDMRFLMSPTAGKYQWYCNNNSIIGMTLEASGNLLLGTSSTSSARLHVENTTGTIATFKRTGGDWAYVFIEAGSTTGNSRLYFSDGASAEGGIDYEHSVDAFRLFAGNTFTFDTAGSEQMRIDSNGNVGIGTDNPIYPLDVNGAYRHGDERTIYQAGGGATTYWFKIYEKHYRTPNAFEWDIAEVDYYGGGQTGAAQYACRLLINIKQQQASDLFQVVMYESINMNNQVAYKFDSTGGDASNGLLEVWIRQPTTYVTNAIFVRRLYNPGILSGGAFSMTSTGSTTQPAGSTLVTGSSY